MVATRSGVQTQVTWAQIADPNLRITLLPQAFSQRCGASQICKRTQSSYYIALNIFFNAVHYGTANVHLKSIRCGTMCLLPPNKDISENCEYCVTTETIETGELLEPNNGCKLVKEVILVIDI